MIQIKRHLQFIFRNLSKNKVKCLANLIDRKLNQINRSVKTNFQIDIKKLNRFIEIKYHHHIPD